MVLKNPVINRIKMSEKIEAIEMTLAHHDRQIEDLSEMISLQWKEIERLKLKLAAAYNKIDEMNSASGDQKEPQSISEIAASEKPPHY